MNLVEETELVKEFVDLIISRVSTLGEARRISSQCEYFISQMINKIGGAQLCEDSRLEIDDSISSNRESIRRITSQSKITDS